MLVFMGFILGLVGMAAAAASGRLRVTSWDVGRHVHTARAWRRLQAAGVIVLPLLALIGGIGLYTANPERFISDLQGRSTWSVIYALSVSVWTALWIRCIFFALLPRHREEAARILAERPTRGNRS